MSFYIIRGIDQNHQLEKSGDCINNKTEDV